MYPVHSNPVELRILHIRGIVSYALLGVLAAMGCDLNLCFADDEKPATSRVQVVDKVGAPVPSAQVEIRLWGGGGEWKETEFRGKTDANGSIKFEGVPTGKYLTVLVRHADFASITSDFSVKVGQNHEVTCRLLPAVQSWFRVVSPDGKAVEGAQVSRLTISNADAELKTVYSNEMFSFFKEGDYRSDSSGMLKLPPLPTGSSATIKVVHPQWATETSIEQDLVSGELVTIKLSKGTRVKARFLGDARTISEIEGQYLRLQSFSYKATGIIHQFPIKNGVTEFCLQPGAYEQFSLSLAGYQITPQFPSSIYEFKELEFDSDNMEKDFVVRKNSEYRGRVITESGEPVSGATVTADSENLIADSDGEFVQLEKLGWWSSDYAKTDSEGYYSVKLPKGKAKIQVAWSGYYSDPESMEIEAGTSKEIPDYVVAPMPIVKGIVVGKNKLPVKNAVVRVRNPGEPTYVVTDEDGRFSLEVENFVWKDKKRLMVANLVAFDSQSNLAQYMKVDLTNPRAFENVELQLVEQTDPNWVIEAVQSEFEIPEDYKSKFEKAIKELEIKFADGRPGNTVPDMGEGTWFNTDAKSLDDFRGKFVLLDFWFIGCGPCIRDMPHIKEAQRIYGEQGFTVVSVHIATQTPGNVKQYADANGIDYPLVVDTTDETILNEYKKIGVAGFPSYLLLGPDGKIVRNDALGGAGSLRMHKLELIHQAIRAHKNQ